MPRVKTNVARLRRKRQLLADAKGFFGRRKNLYKTAKEAVERARRYAYRDRKNRKREFRRLWIVRINAAARMQGMSYSRFMNGLRKAGIETKLMSELWPTMVERMKKPETSPDLVVYWISTYYADPNNWIGEMFHSSQWGTFKASSFYKNPKVDELLDTALRSTDKKVREKAYQDAARIVVDDAAGVWVYNTKYFGPWAKNLDGIRFSPIGNGQEMRWVYYK